MMDKVTRAEESNLVIKSVIAGVIGAMGLVIIYWLILYVITRDFQHPSAQFYNFKYWLVALVLGFGVQVGLYWYGRLLKKSKALAKGVMAVGTTSSTVAMVACCAHHLVDILPIIGFSAAALFLSEYQEYFFGLGVVSNIFGIVIMLTHLKKIKQIRIIK